MLLPGISTFSQSCNYFGENIVFHDSVFYLHSLNDSILIDSSCVSFKYISNVDPTEVEALEDTISLTFLRASGGYNDYQLSEVTSYIECLEIIENSNIIESFIYSLVIKLHEWVPNDYYYNVNWYPDFDEMWFFNVLQAEDAWEFTRGNPNIKIAILDTGVDIAHDDLGDGNDGYSNIDLNVSWNCVENNNNLEDNFSAEGHGTKTLGIVGAKMNNNETGIASIAGGSGDGTDGLTFFMFKISVYDEIRSIGINDAFNRAIENGANIISCSWGENPWEQEDIDESIEYAELNNVLVFASSGNNNYHEVDYPASDEYVIGVGGTIAEWENYMWEEERWAPNNYQGANYGEYLDISAPARVYTTFKCIAGNSKYGSSSGTSLSCPITAGIAGLMLSINPCLKANEVKNILYNTADKVGGYYYNHDPDRPGHSLELGYGRVNAYEALNAVNNLFVTNPIVNDYQVWNNDLYYSYNDIEILPGGTLVLESNVTLRMGDDNKIIIHQGGALYINGATVTAACDGPWKGIEVYGNSYISQTPQNQGMVVINNGTISNAHCGISTAKMGSTPGGVKNVYNRDSSGGIVAANQARFEYNVNAVSFYPYALNNISFFDSCVFITEKDLPGASVNDYFVKMYSVQGISFTRCFFENESTAIPETLGGIYSFSSIFELDGKCENQSVPCNTSYEYSRFENLHYGIRAFTYIPTRWVDIRHTEFDNNVHGIYLSGIENARITTNTFNLNHSAVSDSCYGLYLDECTGYWVEDNDFNGPVISQKGFGIVVNNSGPYDNEIYNNRFENTEYGVNAQKENKNPNHETIGLQILCNKFVNCNSDISVTQAAGTGIAVFQGSLDYGDVSAPAGNWFSYMGIPNISSDLTNDGDFIIYHYHDDITVPVEPQNYTHSTINIQVVTNTPWHEELSCPSCLETGGGSGRSSIKEDILIAEQNIDSTNAILDQLVDGGDTDDLKNDVDFSIPAESMEVYNELMANSPYLSDTVIESAIYKENVLPNTMIRDIMVANPQSAKQDSLMNKIDERWDPMPDYMKAEILQGVNLLSHKEELERLKACYKYKRSHAFYSLIRSFLEDTLSRDLIIDSLINIYTNENDLESKYKLASLYAEKLMFQTGKCIIDSIPDDYSLTTVQQDEFEVFSDYYDYLESCYQDTSVIFYPDSTQLTALLDLTYFETRKTSVLARSILIASGYLNYKEPIFFPDLYKSDKDIEFDEISFFEHTQDVVFMVYPNPSRDYIIAEYSSGKESFKGEISIRGIGGKLLFKTSIIKSQDHLLIDTRNLNQGVYIASLEIEGKQIDSMKFTIAR